MPRTLRQICTVALIEAFRSLNLAGGFLDLPTDDHREDAWPQQLFNVPAQCPSRNRPELLIPGWNRRSAFGGAFGLAIRAQVAATGPSGVSSCTASPDDLPTHAARARGLGPPRKRPRPRSAEATEAAASGLDERSDSLEAVRITGLLDRVGRQ